MQTPDDPQSEHIPPVRSAKQQDAARKSWETRRANAAKLAASPPPLAYDKAARAAPPRPRPRPPAAPAATAPQAPRAPAPPIVALRPERLAFVAVSSDLRDVLRAAYMFVSTDLAQPQRRIVRVESDGETLTLVATNGHCLFEGHIPARQSPITAGAFDLHADSAAQVLTWLKKREPRELVTFDAQAARIYRTSEPSEGLELHRGDADFPPWRRMRDMAKLGPIQGGRFVLHGKYVQRAIVALTHSQNLLFQTHGEETHPIRISGTVADGCPAAVLIAPCRL